MTPESPSLVEVIPAPANLASSASASVAAPSAVAAVNGTSAEELEAFHIVRAILRDLVPTKRIVMRDAQSYCAILLDDNNRKPVCRLRFNNVEKLRIGLFNDKKEEEQFGLDDVDALYGYAQQLRNTINSYIGSSV
jgi:hypothetical protein